MTRMIVPMLAFVTCFAFGCSDKLENAFSTSIQCTGDMFTCEGDQVRICGASKQVAYQPCEAYCTSKELNYTGACEFDETLGHEFCICTDGEPCTNGEGACTEDDNLQLCVEGRWVDVDCTEMCDKEGKDAEGCGVNQTSGDVTCICEGTVASVCAPDYVKCQEYHVNPCGAKGFESISCRNACEKNDLNFKECDYSAGAGEELCRCDEKPESGPCMLFEPYCKNQQSVVVCVDDEEKLLSCADECDAIGLNSIGCLEDEDRGHGACICYDE